MSNLLQFIAEQTSGTFYKSARYCVDAEVKIPSLSYDDPQDFTVQKDKFGETDSGLRTTKNLEQLARQIQQADPPLFSYFLDGSRRIYKVDDIAYQKRIFPIVGGQIGVACCERRSPDNFRKAIFENHLVISLPTLAASDGTGRPELFFGNLLRQINEMTRLKRFNLQFSEVLSYKSDRNDGGREEYMDRGTIEIQSKMIECEKKVVEELVRKNLLNQDNYLIKDGSLQYPKTGIKAMNIETARFRSNFRRVVGVSKSFNPEFSKDKRGQSNAASIANLQPYHRTPVAMYQESRVGNVFFGIWYVRIRASTHSESPFAGVVKLEKVLVTDDEQEHGLDSAEVDRISANIINERNPVCYGKDQRWANHLYPVYLTESFIKSRYLSDLHFINLF